MIKLDNNSNIAIIDYKISNLHSVQAACKKVGLKSIITSDYDVIMKAKAAILPGVGAFGEAMVNLKKLSLDQCIKDYIETRKPFIGICLGMQLLFTESEEFGNHVGLGIVKGRVKKFDFIKESKFKYPIPQIGWNKILQNDSSWDQTLLKYNQKGDFMYFIHSYFVEPESENLILSETNYGETKYCSAISYKNIFATQFHPEKSGEVGLRIYRSLKEKIKFI